MTEQKKEAAVTETAAYYEVSASGTQIRIDRKTGSCYRYGSPVRK